MLREKNLLKINIPSAKSMSIQKWLALKCRRHIITIEMSDSEKASGGVWAHTHIIATFPWVRQESNRKKWNSSRLHVASDFDGFHFGFDITTDLFPIRFWMSNRNSLAKCKLTFFIPSIRAWLDSNYSKSIRDNKRWNDLLGNNPSANHHHVKSCHSG